MKNKLSMNCKIPTVGKGGGAWNPVRGCANYKCPLHPENGGGCWAARECNLHAVPWARYEAKYLKASDYMEIVDAYRGRLENFIPTWFFSQYEKSLPAKPCKIAVGWQSDFAFWPTDWVQKVIEKCRAHPKITFQWLTKEPKAYHKFDWPINCWLGFTACTEDEFNERCGRIAYTERSSAFNRPTPYNSNRVYYAYLEPLLEKIEMHNASWLDWVIVGGQSGKNAKPMHPDWVRSIRDWCIRNDVPFFFKNWGAWLNESQIPLKVIKSIRGDVKYQYGGFLKFGKKSGNILDGRKWEEFPGAGNG